LGEGEGEEKAKHYGAFFSVFFFFALCGRKTKKVGSPPKKGVFTLGIFTCFCLYLFSLGRFFFSLSLFLYNTYINTHTNLRWGTTTASSGEKKGRKRTNKQENFFYFSQWCFFSATRPSSTFVIADVASQPFLSTITTIVEW